MMAAKAAPRETVVAPPALSEMTDAEGVAVPEMVLLEPLPEVTEAVEPDPEPVPVAVAAMVEVSRES